MMAFGDRIKQFGKKYAKIDPFGGRLLGGDEDDRKKFEPQGQFYGGSEAESKAYRKKYAAGAEAGGAGITAATQQANDAATRGAGDMRLRSNAADTMINRGQRQADSAAGGFNQSIGDYRSGRGAILGGADTLERNAANLPQDFRKTADQQFNVNQDRNTRAALSVAAGRGAAGLRQALSGATVSNADAAAQTEITRGQQENEMRQQQRDAVVQAANIRSGVGTQDQNAAAVESGRQQQFEQRAQDANAQGGTFDVQGANLQQNAATLGGQLSLGTQGQFLNAQGAAESAQLQANQKNEDQRQLSERDKYNRKWFPVMSSFNQA